MIQNGQDKGKRVSQITKSVKAFLIIYKCIEKVFPLGIVNSIWELKLNRLLKST